MSKINKLILLAGSLIVIISVAALTINPAKPLHKNPPMLSTPIIALELAESIYELDSLIGQALDSEGAIIRERFTKGIYLDFLYILCFSSFHFALAFFLYKKKMLNKNILWAALLLSFSMAIGDYSENIILLNILHGESNLVRGSYLTPLRIATFIKWISLGLSSLVIAIGLWNFKKRSVAVLFFLVLVFAIGGLQKRFFIEVQAFILAAAWITAFVKCLPLKKSWFAT